MSLLFILALVGSLTAFGLLKHSWLAAFVSLATSLAICAGLLLLHGALSLSDFVDAILPLLPQAVFAIVLAFFIVRLLRKSRVKGGAS